MVAATPSFKGPPMTSKLIAVALSAVATLTAGAALAAPTFYTDEAAFLAAAPATTLEDFSSVPATAVFSLTVGDISIAATSYNPLYPQQFSADGAGDIAVNTSGLAITRTNPAKFTALGVEVYKPALEPGDLTVITDNGAAQYSIDASGLNYEPHYFFGVIDPDGFAQATLTPTEAGDVLAFERLRTSTLPVAGVPEPASWAMMLVGFGLAGNAIRRRRPVAVVA